MRSGRTGSIGLYLRHDQWGTAHGYWAALRGALERAVSNLELGLLVHCGHEDIGTEEAFSRYAGGTVDGVIIFNSAEDPITARLIETGMRAVEIGDSASPLPYVAVDAEDGVRQALEHLHERGYRQPCFVSFPSSYRGSIGQRLDAFLRESERLFGAPGAAIEDFVGEEALASILALSPVPDSAVCVSDEHAYALMAAALRIGMQIPEDLAVTGFDCLLTLGPVPLTTSVRTPIQDLATEGVRKLTALIDGVPVEPRTLLPVSLRIGDTT
jgi:DNA-binding LacI/PurR family transcriptional regulator